jgi:hypothetical protein
VFDAKRLIGRKLNDPTVDLDRKLWPFTVVAGADHVPMIEVIPVHNIYHMHTIHTSIHIVCSLITVYAYVHTWGVRHWYHIVRSISVDVHRTFP